MLQAHTVQVQAGIVRRLVPGEIWCFAEVPDARDSRNSGNGTATGHTGGPNAAMPAAWEGENESGRFAEGGGGAPDDGGAVGLDAGSATTVGGTDLSTAEYLRAARDLLARANLPLNDSDAHVYEKNITLQTELDATKSKLAAVQTEGKQMTERLEEIAESADCKICFQGKSDGVDVNTVRCLVLRTVCFEGG
jgi:hypothetical protein